jgi:hypothetical protein
LATALTSDQTAWWFEAFLSRGSEPEGSVGEVVANRFGPISNVVSSDLTAFVAAYYPRSGVVIAEVG